MGDAEPLCNRAAPEEILPTAMDDNSLNEDHDRTATSNLHLGRQCCNSFAVKEEQRETPCVSSCKGWQVIDCPVPIHQASTVVVKKEPDDIPPTPTDECVLSEDCCGLSMFTLHLERKIPNTFAVKEELDEVSAVSTFEGCYHEGAHCVSSSHDHPVHDETSPVVVKEEPEEILPSPTDCTLHLEEKKGDSFAVKEDYAETDIGDEEESFDSGSGHSSQNDVSDARTQKTDKRQIEHQCRFCAYTSDRRMNVTAHERTHTGEKPFSCRICHKAFASKHSLRRHRRVHTGERPFRCLTCQKAFAYKCHLASHERVHTGERPYKCQTCQKVFARRAHLVCHERVHTGEKPFSCQACHKAFARSSDLLRHETVHTGERPFKCETCEKAFSQRRGLNQHQMACHM